MQLLLSILPALLHASFASPSKALSRTACTVARSLSLIATFASLLSPAPWKILTEMSYFALLRQGSLLL